MRNAIALCLFFFTCFTAAFSQVFPINPDFNAIAEQVNLDSSWGIHTSLKPIMDSAYYPILKYGRGTKPLKSKSKMIRHLTNNHLLEYDREDVYVTLDPLLDLTFMYDESDTSALGNLFSNWRGLRCAGRLGRQVSFQTDFVEVQTRPVYWQRIWIDANGDYQGFGRVKPFQVEAIVTGKQIGRAHV